MSYVRVAIQGTGIGGEVWSINPVFDPTGEFEGTVDQTKLDAATQAIANLSPGTYNVEHLSNAFQLTSARLEVRRDADDTLIAISEQARSTPINGSSTPKMPYQAAIVLSLRTDTPGASGRGRLYWPALGIALTSTARVDTTVRNTTMDNFKVYLKAMESALGAQFAPISFNLAVRSKTTHTTPHVTRLQMGDIIDTQRRRRDSLVESYGSLTYP